MHTSVYSCVYLIFQSTKPIYSFEDNGDYVLDVAWSPTHPALFATVDGGGRLDLWNLNQDTEVPAASLIVEGNPALNRVSWTPSGLHVTVGDNQGRIWVYDVAEVRQSSNLFLFINTKEFKQLTFCLVKLKVVPLLLLLIIFYAFSAFCTSSSR